MTGFMKNNTADVSDCFESFRSLESLFFPPLCFISALIWAERDHLAAASGPGRQL